MSHLARILILVFGLSGPEASIHHAGSADVIDGDVEERTTFEAYFESSASPSEDGAVITGTAWGKFPSLPTADGLSMGLLFCGEELFTSGDFTPVEDYYWRLDFEVVYYVDEDGNVARLASGVLGRGPNTAEAIPMHIYEDADTVEDCDAATVQVVVDWQIDASDLSRITLASLTAVETSR